jgi:hypothetical protein
MLSAAHRRDEADVLAVGLGRGAQPSAPRSPAPRLVDVADRQRDARQFGWRNM